MENKRRFRKKRPLTLLEIMVVIFLIGLISTVVGVNMKGSLDKGKAFKTEKGIEQITEILLLQEAKGEISIQNDIKDLTKVEKCLRNSGLVKDAHELMLDGWKQQYIFDYNETEGRPVITSTKLDAYKKSQKK